MAKLPSFQFYPGDWLKDSNLRMCSKGAQGMWITLLCLMFDCEPRGRLITNGRPWTIREIAEAAGGNVSKNTRLIDELIGKGVARIDDQRAIYSARMVRDEEIRLARANAGAEGGKQTGKQNASKTPANTQAKSGSSSSSSSSDTGAGGASEEEIALITSLFDRLKLEHDATRTKQIKSFLALIRRATPGRWPQLLGLADEVGQWWACQPPGNGSNPIKVFQSRVNGLGGVK